jgi:hypothetical protein
MHKKYIIKFGFGNWTIEIGPIKNKLKDKNYRGHGKSCPRMENHANGTTHFPCLLHDFPFLGMKFAVASLMFVFYLVFYGAYFDSPLMF